MTRHMMCHHQQNFLLGSMHRGSGGPLTPERANSSFESSKYSHGGGDAGNNVLTMIQIIFQEEIECWYVLDLHEDISLCEEILLHEETMIRCHKK